MIRTVTFEKTTYNDLPYKFEAGTPSISGAIGLGAAIEYISQIGFNRIAEHERGLLARATSRIQQLPGVRIIGTAAEKSAIISFVMDGIHPHDISTILDREGGIAIRAGHHCAMPTMLRFGVPATARVSFALYNTETEVDSFGDCLAKVPGFFL